MLAVAVAERVGKRSKKQINEHLQERREVHRGIKNGDKCPNIEKKGRCA